MAVDQNREHARAGSTYESRLVGRGGQDGAAAAGANRCAARALALAASTSRLRGGEVVTSASSSRPVAPATSSTARRNAASLARDGLLAPATLRTYCSAAARTSSGVAGGAKLCRGRMLGSVQSCAEDECSTHDRASVGNNVRQPRAPDRHTRRPARWPRVRQPARQPARQPMRHAGRGFRDGRDWSGGPRRAVRCRSLRGLRCAPICANPSLTCAVERRCVPAGANPARQLSLQPEAVGAVQGGNELH